MRILPAILAVLALALAGCGGDDEEPAPAGSDRPAAETQGTATTEGAGAGEERAAKREGTEVALGDSQFGEILFGPRDQAIYIFEKDPRDETVCYGECAAAWPPVLTKGEPVAGDGVDESLLGTVRRRDGNVQVTYAGKPLYYYAHEGPREVRCHNVNLNGGFWWVVGPDGKRKP